MNIPARVLIVEFLIAAAFASALIRPGRAQFVVPGQVRYQTGCESADASSVRGFVHNPGTGIIRLEGPVVFRFTVANAQSRAPVEVPVDAAVGPGRTEIVALGRLAAELAPNEVCQLDVNAAVK